MHLKQWAAQQGVSYQTARRWREQGILPVATRKVGRLILVDVPPAANGQPDRVAVYGRVSSCDQRQDLDRQVARVAAWSVEQGLVVDRVVTEVGSALNSTRRKFLGLLRDQSVKTIVVEHGDRCARFGAEYLEAALAASGRRLLVVDPDEVDDDLVRDVTEVMTSLCARLYGRRSAANRAARAVEAATSSG